MGQQASGRPSAAGGLLVGAALLAGWAALVAGCNTLLGTPDPVLDGDAATGGPEGSSGADATTDTTTDSTTGDDAATQDAAAPEAADQDAPAGDGASGLPPSCAPDAGPGVTSCGTAADGCCTSLVVGATQYYRAFTAGPGGVATGESAPATLSGFLLDEYEVTVGRFRRFVAATQTGWSPPAGSGIHTHVNGGLGLVQVVDGGSIYESGWVPAWNASMSQPDGGGAGTWDSKLTSCVPSTWTALPGPDEDRPINCVSWYEAYAFCIWDGGFLPSEAEWEAAAAGGAQQREYPWGATDPGTANQFAISGCDYPEGGALDAAGTCSSTANIAPVGSAPLGAGRWGQLDLAGNVHEATLDFASLAFPVPCSDCAELTPLPDRVARGGSWYTASVTLISYERFDYPAIERDLKGGVRCARAP